MGLPHQLSVDHPQTRGLFLSSPRKLVRSLLRLARPLVPVFLDTLSFLLVIRTYNRHPLEAPAFSPHHALHHLIVAGFRAAVIRLHPQQGLGFPALYQHL